MRHPVPVKLHLMIVDISRASDAALAASAADRPRLTAELHAKIAMWEKDPQGAESGLILGELARHDNNKTHAAAALGVPLRTMHKLFDELDLHPKADDQAEELGLTPARGPARLERKPRRAGKVANSARP